jgi:glucose/arabinose dehydrogenase
MTTLRLTRRACGCSAVLALATTAAFAQRDVPFNNGIPVAPTGITVPPLPDAPRAYQTAEGQDIRVVVYARGLTRPWSIAFLPNGDKLVTERPGALRVIRNDVLDPDPVPGVPEVRAVGLSGLFDVALHPNFADNGYVYLTYNKPGPERSSLLGIARGTWNGRALTDVKDIFVSEPGVSSVARMAFGPNDGMLYVTTFGGDAQDPDSQGGKTLRLTDEGGIPSDNPFVGMPGRKAEVYTLGHRSSLGLAFHPGTGDLWQNENGPNGGDEINILKAGANYGWPLVSLGRTYPGPWQSATFSKEGFENPIVYWTPSIAVSGMAFYTGDKLPKWKGDVFVGALRVGEIPGTGHLERILFNEKMEELRRESLLVDLRQRIRDVRMGPDEFLYVLTDEDDGAILRIEPATP